MMNAKKVERIDSRRARKEQPTSHTRIKTSEVVVAMADALEDILRTEEGRSQVA